MGRTYSALTADIRKDPAILERMKLECFAVNNALDVTVLSLGSVTTVVPVLP